MVEIIPKPAERVPAWQTFLLYFSIGLLLMVVLSYFILDIYLKREETTFNNLEQTLAKEKTAEELSLEEVVFGYQRKIEDFSKLINLYLSPSNFFEFIEKNSHPRIWFSKLDLNPRQGVAELSGQTENFVVLHQQLQILRANPLVKNLDLVKIAIGKEGRVNFEIRLDLDPNLFK